MFLRSSTEKLRRRHRNAYRLSVVSAAVMAIAICSSPVHAFSIQFEYRFDNGFFDDPARRYVLESAAQAWAELFDQDWEEIPAGTTLKYRNFWTKQKFEWVLDKPIDDLLIVVQYVDMGTRLVAAANQQRGGLTNPKYIRRLKGAPYQPYLAYISFNSAIKRKWWFDPTPESVNDRPARVADIFEIAMHEIGHILGINTNTPAFKRLQNANKEFVGPRAMAWNGGKPVPFKGPHIGATVSTGVINPNQTRHLMQIGKGMPKLPGYRRFPGPLELAILADLGYRIKLWPRLLIHRAPRP